MEKVYLLLGTNLGNLEENLKRAIKAIAARDIRITKTSRIYKTKPWGVIDQPDYLNIAVEVETERSASDLLSIFKAIERDMGRNMVQEKWQPRVIDIDIIFWGDHVVEEADLKIPHSEFFNRPFAIKILAEIAPDFVPPGSNKTLQEMNTGTKNEGIKIHCD